jgi:hypothetical protein
MSDHPNPGNRYDYITKEAAMLKVTNPIRQTRGFDRVHAHLAELPKAPKTEDAIKTAKTGGGGRAPSGGGADRVPTGRVQPPSTRFKEYPEGDIFSVSVPSNWTELPSNNTVTFAPEGAYGQYNGQSMFTHGVEMGITRNESHDLQKATRA